MTSFIVFNHHSLPFDSREEADRSVPEFLKICIKAQNIGLYTVLVDDIVDKSWFRVKLAPHYFWQEWFQKNQQNENRDLIRAFRSVATRQPLFNTEDIQEGSGLFEVSFENDPSYSALHAAVWHEAPLTSFPTKYPWITSPLEVEVKTLNEAEEITVSKNSILNFYSMNVIEQEVNQLLELRNSLIESGKALFNQRVQLFPNLIFCGSSQQQLISWSASNTILSQVKESLTALNTFCNLWKDQTYTCYSAELLREVGLNHRVSGESDTVLNNPRLKSEREFWLPEGRKELFEHHIKLSNGFRLHFFPNKITKSIYVGHIGHHLKLK